MGKKKTETKTNNASVHDELKQKMNELEKMLKELKEELKKTSKK